MSYLNLLNYKSEYLKKNKLVRQLIKAALLVYSSQSLYLRVKKEFDDFYKDAPTYLKKKIRLTEMKI
jgi:hypothetical protein